MKDVSMIYINFAPYDNAGRILDYLLENFKFVFHFSFDFHRMNTKSVTNVLRIYENKELKSQIQLIKMPTPEALLFISLPFIASLIALQTLWHVFRLYRRFGKISIYFSVNAFTVWLGNIFRGLGVVKKTVFWVWDYFPPGYPDWRIRLARWGYWKFDRWSTTASDRVVFLNRKLEELRKEIGVLPKERDYPVIPIGTHPRPAAAWRGDGIRIGHLGVLKRGQGLDLLFDHLEELRSAIPSIKVEIIGSGPEEKYFKERAALHGEAVEFFGFLENADDLEQVMRHWNVGLATYIPGKSNESHWTDPSKIKAYISLGIPVITTNVTDFSNEIGRAKAGIVVDYFKRGDFTKAVQSIAADPETYRDGAAGLARKYDYKAIYPGLFAGTW
jgi:glycosyltransferase involved in cell wall biosynthesis